MVAMESNPGIKVIENSIQIAEERFIKPAMCRDLYNAFRSVKNVLVTDVNISLLESEDYFNTTLEVGQIANAIEFVNDPWLVSLWNEQLWKLTAEAVLYVATVPNWSRFSASGEMVNNPKAITDNGSGSASVDLADIKFKLSKLQQDVIDPLIASTKEYLAVNRGNYPLFNCHRDLLCGCEEEEFRNGNLTGNNGISVARKTGWVHAHNRGGFYDRREYRENDTY